MASGTYIRLGVFKRTYGLEGGLHCAPDMEILPELAIPCPVRYGYTEGFSKPGTLLRYRHSKGSIICFMEGASTPEQAQAFIDQALYIEEEHLRYPDPKSSPGIVGYEVIDDESGKAIGAISGIFKTQAHLVWEINSEGNIWLLPAIDEFVLDIDKKTSTARVRLIPGLYTEGPDDEGE